jgi:hypothetical protein
LLKNRKAGHLGADYLAPVPGVSGMVDLSHAASGTAHAQPPGINPASGRLFGEENCDWIHNGAEVMV